MTAPKWLQIKTTSGTQWGQGVSEVFGLLGRAGAEEDVVVVERNWVLPVSAKKVAGVKHCPLVAACGPQSQ